jgi:hypothetical protein
MKNYSKLLASLFILLLFNCSSDDNGDSNNGGGGLIAQATYRITFTTNFTSETHPTDYPDNASFTKMFIVAHSSSTSIFSLGQFASPGLELYVEEGDNSIISSEHIQTGDDNVNQTIIINGNNDIGPTNSDSVEFTITPNTTLISFISKISPSPDWFVGVDSFNLVNPDNSLVDEITIQLFPIDAGTDSGETYNSDDVDETNFISSITGAPFTSQIGTNILVNRIGTLKIERVN